MVVVVLGLFAVTAVLLVQFANLQPRPEPDPRPEPEPRQRMRVGLAVGVLFGLWLLSFVFIIHGRRGGERCHGRAIQFPFIITVIPYLVSGPIAYWIGRRRWLLFLPLPLLVVWGVLALNAM